MDKSSQNPMQEVPLGRKVSHLLFLASSVVLLTSAVVMAIYEVASFESRQLHRAEAQAERLGPSLHAPLELQQTKEAQEALSTLAMQPRLRAACVYLGDRSEFAHFSRSVGRQTEPGGRHDFCPRLTTGAMNHFEGDSFHFYHRILAQERALGTLLLVYDLPSFSHRIGAYFPQAGAILLALLAFSLLLLGGLKRIVSEPLRELALTADRTVAEEDWDTQIKAKSFGEISHLATTLNGLFLAIQQRDSNIRRARREYGAIQEQLVQAQKMESIGRLVGGGGP